MVNGVGPVSGGGGPSRIDRSSSHGDMGAGLAGAAVDFLRGLNERTPGAAANSAFSAGSQPVTRISEVDVVAFASRFDRGAEGATQGLRAIANQVQSSSGRQDLITSINSVGSTSQMLAGSHEAGLAPQHIAALYSMIAATSAPSEIVIDSQVIEIVDAAAARFGLLALRETAAATVESRLILSTAKEKLEGLAKGAGLAEGPAKAMAERCITKGLEAFSNERFAAAVSRFVVADFAKQAAFWTRHPQKLTDIIHVDHAAKLYSLIAAVSISPHFDGVEKIDSEVGARRFGAIREAMQYLEGIQPSASAKSLVGLGFVYAALETLSEDNNPRVQQVIPPTFQQAIAEAIASAGHSFQIIGQEGSPSGVAPITPAALFDLIKRSGTKDPTPRVEKIGESGALGGGLNGGPNNGSPSRQTSQRSGEAPAAASTFERVNIVNDPKAAVEAIERILRGMKHGEKLYIGRNDFADKSDGHVIQLSPDEGATSHSIFGYISGKHLEIVKSIADDRTKYTITNRSTSNGTKLNDVRMQVGVEILADSTDRVCMTANQPVVKFTLP